MAASPFLSICIATYNRAGFIAETLDSILTEIPEGVEIVVVDGASPDATPSVIKEYSHKYPIIKYFRESSNSGVDIDYDKAVGYAQGVYCWLMSDDDLIKIGAVAKVIAELVNCTPDLLIVNAELVSKDLSVVLDSNRLGVDKRREYTTESAFNFMAECASYLSFIGCVIIRRSIWMSRRREHYYGSCFIHVGVIFQSPPLEKTVVMSNPLISIRHGNASWSPRSFEIWNFNWQKLIWSFSNYPESIRSGITSREPWRKMRTLLYARAMGSYTLVEYKKYIAPRVEFPLRMKHWVAAIFPPVLANIGVLTYFLIFKKKLNLAHYDLLRVQSGSIIGRWLYKILG